MRYEWKGDEGRKYVNCNPQVRWLTSTKRGKFVLKNSWAVLPSGMMYLRGIETIAVSLAWYFQEFQL